MSKCKGCKKYHENADCKECEPDYKITNADRIRSMNDEELAEFLGRYFNCEYECEAAKEDCFENCNRAIIEWLQSEAE